MISGMFGGNLERQTLKNNKELAVKRSVGLVNDPCYFATMQTGALSVMHGEN